MNKFRSFVSFEMPMSLMWSRGTLFTALPMRGFLTVSAHCHSLLGNEALMTKLKRTSFRVAVVDILYNECSLALAHSLGS